MAQGCRSRRSARQLLALYAILWTNIVKPADLVFRRRLTYYSPHRLNSYLASPALLLVCYAVCARRRHTSSNIHVSVMGTPPLPPPTRYTQAGDGQDVDGGTWRLGGLDVTNLYHT